MAVSSVVVVSSIAISNSQKQSEESEPSSSDSGPSGSSGDNSNSNETSNEQSNPQDEKEKPTNSNEESSQDDESISTNPTITVENANQEDQVTSEIDPTPNEPKEIFIDFGQGIPAYITTKNVANPKGIVNLGKVLKLRGVHQVNQVGFQLNYPSCFLTQ